MDVNIDKIRERLEAHCLGDASWDDVIYLYQEVIRLKADNFRLESEAEKLRDANLRNRNIGHAAIKATQKAMTVRENAADQAKRLGIALTKIKLMLNVDGTIGAMRIRQKKAVDIADRALSGSSISVLEDIRIDRDFG